MISNELFVGIVFPIIVGTGAWVRSVETRFIEHQEVIKKIDQLVSILLEDRLAGSTNQRTED